MIEHLGPLGLLCRLGGEEFALLANDQDMEEVLDGVWAFRDRLAAEPIVIGEQAVDDHDLGRRSKAATGRHFQSAVRRC